MGWLTNFRLKRAQRLLEKHFGQRTLEWPVTARDDGFVPDAVFTGGALEDNLLASIWCFSAITANAEAVASLPAIVQRRGENDKEPQWVRLPNHPLYKFLQQPLGNKYSKTPRWSWQKLFEMAALQVELAGNAYWYPMFSNRGREISVQPLLKPERMKADVDRRGYPKVFHYEDRPFDPEDLINIQSTHPSNFWKGMSVFHAAQKDVGIDQIAHSRTRANLKNRVGASLVLKKDNWFGLTDEERTKTLAWLKAEHQATNKDGMPLVIGKAWDLDQVPNQDHSPLIFNARKLSREGIMAATKVPPTILGIYENATLQNFNISRVIWWTNKLFPLASQIYTDINMHIIWPRFGHNVRLWYDLAGTPIGLTVVKEKAEAAGVMVSELGYPTNAASAHVGLGMPYFPELDEANTHLTKAGRDPEKKEPTPDEKADEDAKAAALAEAEESK
jgi:phage portal protein BeeE